MKRGGIMKYRISVIDNSSKAVLELPIMDNFDAWINTLDKLRIFLNQVDYEIIAETLVYNEDNNQIKINKVEFHE